MDEVIYAIQEEVRYTKTEPRIIGDFLESPKKNFFTP